MKNWKQLDEEKRVEDHTKILQEQTCKQAIWKNSYEAFKEYRKSA